MQGGINVDIDVKHRDKRDNRGNAYNHGLFGRNHHRDSGVTERDNAYNQGGAPRDRSVTERDTRHALSRWITQSVPAETPMAIGVATVVPLVTVFYIYFARNFCGIEREPWPRRSAGARCSPRAGFHLRSLGVSPVGFPKNQGGRLKGASQARPPTGGVAPDGRKAPCGGAAHLKFSRKCLPLYVNEFEFRYNNRNYPHIFGAAPRAC